MKPPPPALRAALAYLLHHLDQLTPARQVLVLPLLLALVAAAAAALVVLACAALATAGAAALAMAARAGILAATTPERSLP